MKQEVAKSVKENEYTNVIPVLMRLIVNVT